MAPEKNIINGNQLRNSSNIFTSISAPHLPFNATGTQVTAPPALPPRQSIQNYSGYNDYRPFGSSYYGNYGYGGGYRNYNGYGSFGSYMPYSNMSTYNNYGQIGGHSGDMESRFQHYAEESTRSTFRIVETVLQTFSSITMLLESTYFALTNSFRAILSVAENIGRLRSTIGQLLSTFALIRLLKWIYKKILSMLGLQSQNAVEEELWQRSVTQMTNSEKTSVSSWSNILFLGIFVAIPYLIHKISNNVKQIQSQGTDPKEWVKCEDPVYVATAMYDFAAASNEELSLKAGQKLWLAPRSLQSKSVPGWWMATDNVNIGLVPSNYVTIVGQLKRKSELESNKNETASTSKPISIQNITASNEQAASYINMPESCTNQESTDFFEQVNKSDLS